ncbi:transglutaminase family protein [Acidiphilium acidophilum]|uniref:Transglutaminase family protein n=1 Tax=Acidiphilium acidophilum TaxID=76588 RepID=A0AAW9DT70_ACIAO|nr:transglutaminase family protein [Acidiphilium acidophilum]MDX5932414.1 transglutaminase family protein [Acidiphilium acidophilum]
MSIQVALTHRTSYKYDRPVRLGPQTIRLRPAPYARTPILAYTLAVAPKPHFLNWLQDPQGNFLARVVFPEAVTEFSVTVDLIADMATINPFDFFLEPEAETWPFAYDPVLEQELAPFRRTETPGPLLAALIEQGAAIEASTVNKLVALNALVQSRVAYVVRMEPGVWSPEHTLAEARGSCRDSAWLLVHLLRHLGFAARFCSGYLIQLVADVKPVEGPAGPTEDFTDLHAWAEVYLPGAGWIGLDATSGLLTGEGHIPLAASPDPISAAPISGGVEPAGVEFDFAMTIRRIEQTPRVTRPYDEADWQAILAMGQRVDAALAVNDVRLTMGGEPTFVSATDIDAPEWNIDALGPTKRTMAGRLLRRIAPVWAQGAVLQYAQGKLYPGEPLPRWALHAFWREDGEPVWQNPALLASDDDIADHPGDATAATATAFATALAEALGIDPAFVMQAYEDVHYYLWRESKLPANVRAEASRIADPIERARLARLFTGDLTAPSGAVLPLRRVADGAARLWQSARWTLRGGDLVLIPGDSPIGLRLPLDQLPWEDPAETETDIPDDPFAPHPRLPSAAALHAGLPTAPVAALPQKLRGEAPGIVRTALAVEARGGYLHVFLPPLAAVEDFLVLIAAIEKTAAASGRRIFLEGYQPPDDPRLLSFSVTPDPGVIEVNLPPAATWPTLVHRTLELYEFARETGLAAEKFMLDGRHVGTGGGNHVVMGAAEAADSPFLRRPDLLKSLLGFWHNHPSLSYLFSGLFIGPSSQHPRIDEARDDTVLELETAFRQIKPGEETAPWVIDRLLRNILCDMTGNLHRTEFCIDKLYAPGAASGRRGLVEFRAFEMPPDARMSVAQALLMRACVAAFWQTPYERRLIRWGTRLNDRFMLPHYVAADLRDALEELAMRGFALDPAWFAPHQEFRFPKLGAVTIAGIGLELRHALEPWHVLGEEQSGSGTARYVDSAVERVQVKLTDWNDERFTLACNGIAVPLTETGIAGERVAGIRFKAWSPPSSLHPMIKPQTPLIFDVIDQWTGRALGGMTHHTVHPGGRGYEKFPVNANEAEARRRSRFLAFGHTPGEIEPVTGAVSAEHPITLDLRRFA